MFLVLPSLSKRIYDAGKTDYGGQEVLEKSVMLPKKEFLSYDNISGPDKCSIIHE
jgi:hypothetical protein